MLPLPLSSQGALLAVERHHVNELRKGISEIKDHCSYLEEENEELNMLRSLSERQIQDLGSAAAEQKRIAVELDRDRSHRGIMDRPAQHAGIDRERDRHPGGRGYNMNSTGRGDVYGRRGRGRGDTGVGGRFAGHKRMR